MNKFLFFLVTIGMLPSCNEKEDLAKKEFREKISKSFASVKSFSFLDTNKIIYADTAFHLPAPVYKAMVINGDAPYDSIFFYYYHRKDLQRVFNIRFSKESFTIDTRVLDCGNFFIDSVTSNFFLYLRNCPSVEEMIAQFGKLSYLDSSLSANFGMQPPKVMLEEVRQEVSVEEPPPPPPPKPKNKKAAR